MKKINESVLDTIAACGDVNRNTMCNPNPYQSHIHKEINDYATKISDHHYLRPMPIMKFG